MIIKEFIYILLSISILMLLASCKSEERHNELLLEDIANSIENEHQQALEILQKVNAAQLTQEQYAWFTLLQVRAWNLENTNINSSEEEILKAKDYFIITHNAAKAAYACFVYAHIFYSEGNMGKALYHFLQAEEWAKKADYKLSYLSSYLIFYNIALLYWQDGKYQEALLYQIEADKFIKLENGKYQYKIYSSELKGLIYQNINILDSAAYYYRHATQIADQHNDSTNFSRISYNQSVLHYTNKNYVLAEQKCKQSISMTAASDSIAMGRRYITLAYIYTDTYRNDSAILYLQEAERLLQNATPPLKKSLYEILEITHRKKGNIKKVIEYTELYTKHSEKSVNPFSKEIEQLNEKLKQAQADRISETLRVQNSYRAGMQEKGRQLTMFFILTCILLVLPFLSIRFYIQKAKKKRKELEKSIREKELQYKQIITKKELDVEIFMAEKNKAYDRVADQLKAYSEETERIIINPIVHKEVKERDELIERWKQEYSKLKDDYINVCTQLAHMNGEAKNTSSLKIIKKLLNTGKKETVQNLINSLLEIYSWNNLLILLMPEYKAVFRKLKTELHSLSDDEYVYCCLYLTKQFSPEKIKTILQLDNEKAKLIKNAILDKLASLGYSLAYLKTHHIKIKPNK